MASGPDLTGSGHNGTSGTPVTEYRRYNRVIRSTSLTTRIFLACALLAAASLGLAFTYVNARASREAEAQLRRGVAEASALVDENRAAFTDTFTRLARLVADLPKLKAAMATDDPPTVQPLADDYRNEMRADVLVLTGRTGSPLGASGADPAAIPAAAHSFTGLEQAALFAEHPRGLLQVVSVPVFLDGEPPEILGRLTAGFLLDDQVAGQLRRLTGSEIAFAIDGRIRASTLPDEAEHELAALLHHREIANVSVDGEDFVGVAHALHAPVSAGPSPIALILRSRTERLQFLNTIRMGLIVALIVALPLATLVSFGVARSVARPLTAITKAMRDVAATGDLTRKVALRSGRWDDADAKLLASSFNTLTESLAQFQREAAQKDRLSSLGRLSTVIAHEVRNPLMIIKSALRALQQPSELDPEQRDALDDIDEETDRLNRIVSDVLDFARPISFNLAEVDLNQVCRESVAAAWAGCDQDVRLQLDETLPHVRLDGERLRTALVNLLSNARQAVERADVRRDAVTVTTSQRDRHAIVEVLDGGTGIAAEDMPHVFDPYFTTRRGGTGLGLPIARTIVEGLGGRITISSTEGRGTRIHVDFPLGGPP